MKQVFLRLVAVFAITFSLASLIPLLPNNFYRSLTVFILFHLLIMGLVNVHLKKPTPYAYMEYT